MAAVGIPHSGRSVEIVDQMQRVIDGWRDGFVLDREFTRTLQYLIRDFDAHQVVLRRGR